MEKNKVLFKPLDYAEADVIIRKVYHSFFNLRKY